MPICKPKPTSDPDLTAEQATALEQLLDFPNQVQTLGGYAGTGKTTLIKHLVRELPNFAVCAFTGKAANVLRRKGVGASTIHSLIYQPVEVPRLDNTGKLLRDGKGRVVVDVVFERRDELPCSGIVIDEASMVSEVIYDDLSAYGLPLIFVGDHGQLEPVGGRDFNLMRNPQITLEQIHRNAGPISRFANFLREGHTAHEWQRAFGEQYHQVEVLTMAEADARGNYATYDQIIVGFNRLRVHMNKVVREDYLGLPPDTVSPGDRVMALRNHRTLGLFNGMQGIVTEVGPKCAMRFRTDTTEQTVRYIPTQFNSEKTLPWDKNEPGMPFDYSYAITAHKAQGDEWNHVCVAEERMPHWMWDVKRWRYTAASRAKRKLTWVNI